MNIDEEFYKPDYSGDFERPFAYAFIGWFVGSLIARTRFGQWFEHSKIIGWILSLICLGIVGYLIYCCIVFIVILIVIMLG